MSSFLRTLFLSATAMGMVATSQAQLGGTTTFNFTVNDPTAWADGIAADGDGGSVNAANFDLEIFAADTSLNLLPGATMEWVDDYSADGFDGITPGPLTTVTNTGIPVIRIRSTDTKDAFNLESITLLDWGGNPIIVEGISRGNSLGTFLVHLPQDGTSQTFTLNQELAQNAFSRIDEVRIYGQGGLPVWIVLNDIQLSTAISLPLSWKEFSATNHHNNALLRWSTASEHNTRNFVVQHSTNGTTWSDAATLAAAGQSAEVRSYEFVHTTPAGGDNYYRIRQNDVDGSYSYSSIRRLQIAAQQGHMSLLEQPARNGQISLELNQPMEVSLLSVDGRLVWKQSLQAGRHRLQPAALSSGLYWLRGRGQSIKVLVP